MISALLGIAALVWILSGVIIRGVGALDLSFFTQLPTPPGMAGGGMANAILGTLAMTVAATLMSVPIGLLSGIYLAEFGQDSRVADNSRFAANVLMGMPSIIIGVFAYTLVVLPPRAFLRLCRHGGPGHPDDPGGHPDRRGHAASGAQHLAGNSPGPGRPALEASL